MNERNPFDLFISLIDFDQSVYKKECSLEEHKQAIAALHGQKKLLDMQLQEAKQILHDAKKAVDEKELEMKELELQEKDKKKKLDFVTTQKEYQSIKHEMELLASEQAAFEDVLVDAWNMLDQAQKKYAQQHDVYEQKVISLQNEVKKKEEELIKIEHELNEQQKIRDSKKDGVPSEWLEKYVMMRSRVTDPVVPVDEGSCSSCYHALTEQEIAQISRRKLLQCKFCYRFLYSVNRR